MYAKGLYVPYLTVGAAANAARIAL